MKSKTQKIIILGSNRFKLAILMGFFFVFIPLVSATFFTYNNQPQPTLSGSPYTGKTGEMINLTEESRLVNVTLESGTDVTTCYLGTTVQGTELGTETISGLVATFNVDLNALTNYSITCDKGGSPYTLKYSNVGGTKPTTDGFLTWLGAIYENGGVWSTNSYSIESLTFSNDTTNPNVSIISPSSSEATKSFPINVTCSDDTSCIHCEYNITRGASTEVATTSLNQVGYSWNGTTVVSTYADYVLNAYCYDGSLNGNLTSLSFSVSESGGGVTLGGGGGSIPTAQITAGTFIRGAVCQPFKDDFYTAWEESKTREFTDSLEKFSYLWSKFWNYALCSGAASTIVPL